MVPALPSTNEDITWEEVTRHTVRERYGALLADPSIQALPMDAEKKRAIDELVNKFRGEEGERLVVLPIFQNLSKMSADPDATVIMGQKSTLELVEDDMKKLLANDPFADPIDRELAIAKKVAAAVCITLDLPAIVQSVKATIVEYMGQTGVQPVAHMMARVVALENITPAGLSSNEKKHRAKKLKGIRDILDSATNRHLNAIDLSKELKLTEIRKVINSHKKEHDIVLLKPEFRTVLQTEVKAMTSKQTGEVTTALKQLLGAKEEYARVHGHVLNPDWTYVGVVALPNLPVTMKPELVRDLRICSPCSNYLLVGDMENAMGNLLRNIFAPGGQFQDEVGLQGWRRQYQDLTWRLLAMDHLIKPIPEVERITGRTDPIGAAYTEGGTWQAPWVSGSPNQTLAEPQFLQLLCVAFSSSAHLAEWYYVMIMGGLWHQVRAFSQ